jgi:DNA-binding protein HU-beta
LDISKKSITFALVFENKLTLKYFNIMTKAEFVREISNETGYSQRAILEIVEAGMDICKKQVAAGDNLSLRGFGTFGHKVRKQKVARIITKQQSIVVPEHKIPSFKPAKEFAAKLK